MIEPTNALAVGYVLRSAQHQYRIERVLGTGGFGITYLASATVKVGNVSGRFTFAIKEHFLSSMCEREKGTSRVVYSTPVRAQVENSRKDFIAEAKRLHNVGVTHPNIVKVNEVFETNNTAYYVMEYLDGKSLRAYVREHGTLSEAEMHTLMNPIVDAVKSLHDARMTHLDIKPDNIMLSHNDDGTLRPVLIDFGLSKHYDKDGRPTSTINSMGCSDGYSPIEQYSGITTFSPGADIYALGATMAFCLTGKDPQKSTELYGTTLADGLNASPKCKAIIAAMTVPNPAKRSYGRSWLSLDSGKPYADDRNRNTTNSRPHATTTKSTKVILNQKHNRKWLWLAVPIVLLLLLLYFLRVNSNPENIMINRDDSDSLNIQVETSNTELQQYPTNDTVESWASRIDSILVSEAIQSTTVPTPQKVNGPNEYPFNAAGCPFVYVKGSDRNSMAANKTIEFSVYNRKYVFSVGDNHPNGTRALVTVGDYGHNLLEDIELSEDDFDVFFDEFFDLKQDCNLQLTAMDFNNDDECELLLSVQSEDMGIEKTFVFKLYPQPYKDSIVKCLGVADGQRNMYIDGTNIIAPYGSQGLFNEYILTTNDRIINIVD